MALDAERLEDEDSQDHEPNFRCPGCELNTGIGRYCLACLYELTPHLTSSTRCPWCGADPTTPNVDHPDGMCGTTS